MTNEWYASRLFNANAIALARLLDIATRAVSTTANGSSSENLSAARSDLRQARRIAVLHTHRLGDLVMLLPVLSQLRRHYPEAELTLVSNCDAASLLGADSPVNQIVPWTVPWVSAEFSLESIADFASVIRRLRRSKIDLALDPRGDIRNSTVLWATGARRRVGYVFTGGSAFLTDVAPAPNCDHLIDISLGVLAPLGVRVEALTWSERTPQLVVNRKIRRSLAQYLRAKGIEAKRFVIVHPGASSATRHWSPAAWARVLEILDSYGIRTCIVVGPSEKVLARQIVNHLHACKAAVLQPTLEELGGLLSLSRVFVGMDSGPGHVAAAVGTRVISLFGDSDPTLSGPRGSHALVHQSPGGRLDLLQPREIAGSVMRMWRRGESASS